MSYKVRYSIQRYKEGRFKQKFFNNRTSGNNKAGSLRLEKLKNTSISRLSVFTKTSSSISISELLSRTFASVIFLASPDVISDPDNLTFRSGYAKITSGICSLYFSASSRDASLPYSRFSFKVQGIRSVSPLR